MGVMVLVFLVIRLVVDYCTISEITAPIPLFEFDPVANPVFLLAENGYLHRLSFHSPSNQMTLYIMADNNRIKNSVVVILSLILTPSVL